MPVIIPQNFFAFPRIALVKVYGLLTRVKTHNFSNVPLNTSVLLAVNHTTGIDPIILLIALRKKIYFIADADNFKYRISTLFMRKVANSIPLDQSNIRKNSMTLKEMLKIKDRENALFGFFPEGRRHSLNGPGKLYKGAAYFSYKLNIPLLPVYIHNHLKGPPRETLIGRRRILEGLIAITINIFRKINVFIGEPVYPSEIQLKESYRKKEVNQDMGLHQMSNYKRKIDKIHKLLKEQFDNLRSKAK